MRVAAMPAGDRADDGQAEAGAALATCVVGAREAVERASCEARWEAGSGVADVELDRPATSSLS
jgi:hypothetical protein